MKKAVIRDLNKEQNIARFGPLQMGFVIYSIVFMLLCRNDKPLDPYLDFTVTLPVFIALFVTAVILAAMVLIYNRKNEVRRANRTASYIYAAADICFGVYWLINFA